MAASTTSRGPCRPELQRWTSSVPPCDAPVRTSRWLPTAAAWVRLSPQRIRLLKRGPELRSSTSECCDLWTTRPSWPRCGARTGWSSSTRGGGPAACRRRSPPGLLSRRSMTWTPRSSGYAPRRSPCRTPNTSRMPRCPNRRTSWRRHVGRWPQMGDFRMPSLGADMDEGTLLEWLVRPGDIVHRGDILAVVDTAKSAVEVECFADGVVEALVIDPGQVVPVGGVLARFAENAPSPGPSGAATMKDAPPQDQPPEPQPPEPQPCEPALPAVAPIAPSPLVRRRAHELGIALTTIHGSGGGGAVIRQDIEETAHRAVSRPR